MNVTPLAALGLAVAALSAPSFAAQVDDPTEATAEAAAEAMADAFTIDTPIETLMADERAKAAVSAHLPGIDQHPAYEQFKALSLKAVAPFSQGLITEDVLAKIAADLAAIK